MQVQDPMSKQDNEMGVARFIFGIVLLALVVGFWVCLWVPMSLGF
jgi:hypothetical protein